MNNASDFDLNRHISALADRSTRTYNAAAVAQSIGLRALIFLLRDRELDVHRPAPGFPQTLAGGPTWSALLSKCATAGEFKTTVAYPDAQHFESAHVWVGTDSTVLIFIGGEPRVPASRFAEASHLLIALLHSEAREDAATAAAQRAGDVTRRATALASALEQARAQVAGNARSLRDALAEAARLNNELRLMNGTLEQRVAEEAAERDRIWQTSQDLLAVVDGNGVFKAANPAWTAMLGWSPDEVIGQNHLLFSHPDDVNRSEVALDQALEAPLLAYENRCRHKDGSFLWVSWVASVENGLVYAAGRNIQAEKDAAEQLGVAQEALRQSQKMEAVGQLTGGIAHDFNNMLAVVIGSLDLLDRRIGPEDDRLRRYVTAAAEGARRAATLTKRLLAFSRQQPLSPKRIDVNTLVSGMSDLLRHSIGAEVRLETVLAGGLWFAHADPNQLENVILNLAVNGRDAMPEGGRLTIETQNAHLDHRYVSAHIGVPEGHYVMVAVTDTGCGMPPDVIQKAFDPFFTTKDVGQGTGLGLSQVYGFTKQSGGHVKIYSELGRGTTVKIYLPRMFSTADEEHSWRNDVQLPLGGSDEVILVVDDEPAVRKLAVEVLTELGYRVLEADGAATALRLIETHNEIALLFTDVIMPDVNGRKLAEAAKARRPNLKVLYTTGYTRNAVVHNGVLDAGVNLLGKPFSVDDVACKVRAVLDSMHDDFD